MHQQFSNLYSTVKYNDCIFEHEVLKFKLHVGFVDPIEFAYLCNDGPGATAVTAGEVIYVARCKLIFAVLRNTGLCYKEILLNITGKPMFANARTKILQIYGSPIPCSGILSMKIKELNSWYSISPNVMAISTLKNGSLELKHGWEYQSMTKVIGGGLYSPQFMEEARKVLLYPCDHSSVTSSWPHQELSGQYFYKEIDITSTMNVDVVSSYEYLSVKLKETLHCVHMMIIQLLLTE